MKLNADLPISGGSGSIRRRAISSSQKDWVNLIPADSGKLPMMVQCDVQGVSLSAWAGANLQIIDHEVIHHGAILFRGFEVDRISEFREFLSAVSQELMEYRDAATPRRQVDDHLYTSTEYPAEHWIELHNESVYSRTWPQRIYFFCAAPAEEGGETPIADSRRVYKRISPPIRRRFAELKVLYVRNFKPGLGPSWQTVFGSSDKSEVARICAREGSQCEWVSEAHLRVRQVRPALASHPRTGERVWLNQVTAFHVTTLDPKSRDALLAEVSEENLPKNCYYGNGSPIESDVLDEIRQAYQSEMLRFAWRKNDILLLDNMLTAHGRAPFKGLRRIVVAMSEPVRWDDVLEEDWT